MWRAKIITAKAQKGYCNSPEKWYSIFVSKNTAKKQKMNREVTEMKDKNGVEIRTGQIVEVSGAYFKNDNGLWCVVASPGDPWWSGKDYSMRRISKKGKLSVAKDNICFWPIGVFVNDPVKKAEAKSWNAEHAGIEVVHNVDRSQVADLFAKDVIRLREEKKFAIDLFGEGNSEVNLIARIIEGKERLVAEIEEDK